MIDNEINKQNINKYEKNELGLAINLFQNTIYNDKNLHFEGKFIVTEDDYEWLDKNMFAGGFLNYGIDLYAKVPIGKKYKYNGYKFLNINRIDLERCLRNMKVPIQNEKEDEKIESMKLLKYKELKNKTILDLTEKSANIKIMENFKNNDNEGTEKSRKLSYENKKKKVIYVLERIKEKRNKNLNNSNDYKSEIFYFNKDFNKASALNFLYQFDVMLKSEKEKLFEKENNNSNKRGIGR